MFKRVISTGLIFSMIMGSGTGVFANDNGSTQDDRKEEIHLTFGDLKNAEWAMRYIASLASKRVFEGYEDGTFKPQNTVSRIEAITAAVRLMGLRSQAESSEKMNTFLNFKDADKVPSWAVGYVAVALENDLLSKNDDLVQPLREGDRLWATTLLVKVLKLETNAKAKMYTTLPFKDAKQIPAGSIGYEAVAIEKGLVDGFEDNTFRPNQPVTRAQLAALLDRTGSLLPDQEKNTTTGTVSGVLNDNELIITSSGTTSTFSLHPDVFIYRNGGKVVPSDLLAGEEVKVRTYNNKIVFIEVTKAITENPAPTPTPSTPKPTPTPVPQIPSSTDLTEEEQQMLELVNKERAAVGLSTLVVDLTLTKTARLKSQDMVDNKYFSHDSPTYGSPFDMMKKSGITYKAAGENIACYQNVQAAHDGLMKSPGHKANILSKDFTHIGIGIESGGPCGKMFTQQFIGK